jgi:4-amino-4-deoxy-L-arabinose transferase-like glycosyltransferase
VKILELNFSKKILYFILIFLIIIAFFLRLFRLGELPAVMHRDELAIAYNAYSIVETGRDEWGESYPIVFKSFGDYKLPGLIYSSILGIKIFGLNPFGARVINAILASLAIPAMFIFTKELFKSRFVSLVSTILLVFSFWHLSGSRNVYEPIVALSLFIPNYLTLFKATEDKRYLLLSVVFFAISIWFYHTPLFIYPLMYVLWYFFKRKQLSSKAKKWWAIFFVLTILIFLINSLAVVTLNKSRSETTIFMSQQLKDMYQESLHKYWSAGIPLHPVFTIPQRIFQLSYYFVQGYIKGISPDFIFFNGGNNSWHNLKSIGFGNINPILLPFSIMGLIYVIKNKKKPAYYFLLSLLVLTPIPNALTIDSPNTNRLIDFHFLILILAAFGFYYFCNLEFLKNKIAKKIHKIMIALSLVFYIVITGQFLSNYFLIFNYSLDSSWNEGFPELVQQIENYRDDYDKVIMVTTTSESHIFYLFYTAYPPEKIQVQNDDLNHAHKIENIYFWVDLKTLELEEDEKILLISSANEKIKNPIFTVNDWQGKVLWQGYELEIEEVAN